MKITGNEDKDKLANDTVSQASIESTSTGNILADVIFFNSLEASTEIKQSDFETGKFQVQLDVSKIADIPSITVGIDNLQVVQDLFKDSDNSADNRQGVLEFIRAGILQALTTSFSVNTFNDSLQILDEKLKSKVLEIQNSDIENGKLVKTEEVPNLVTSQEDLEPKDDSIEVSEIGVVKEQEDLKAQGFDEHSLEEEKPKEYKQPPAPAPLDIDEDEEMPENYKPLSDGTNDNQPLKADDEGEEEEEDGGELESIGRINH